MKRKIVRIDEEKCDGCGLCVDACHEGALELVNGKARLVSESYCDGLGNCLPECPAGAITIEERDAADFDGEAVQQRLEAKRAGAPEKTGEKHTCACEGTHGHGIVPETLEPEALERKDAPEILACGCPGTQSRLIERDGHEHGDAAPQGTRAQESQLRQWPCQIRLVPAGAPYLDNAHLLVAADCTAYAYANLHQDFMRKRVTLIGCPKLDDADYAGKLTEILTKHEIRSITVLRMEVPCCGGIVEAVRQALIDSGRMIPWRVVTIGTGGSIIEDI